jgi:mRNA interferase MazF
MAGDYVPDEGDLIWLELTHPAGGEPAGRRPALVVSPRSYNGKATLALVCPIVSHAKGYPFEVALPASVKFKGVVLSDHLRSLDWRERRASKAGSVSSAILRLVRERLALLLGLE